MNIVLVQATNWMSHVDSTLEPGDARFLTLRGQHGVGKTALIEAVSYALYGRGRFDTVDEPVRHGASDMSVRVEWIAPDGLRYRVIRRRTTRADGKSSLNLAVQRPDGAWTSLDDEGGTIKATEAAIRGVVGVDGETFEAIAFLMQGRITALVEAAPAGRRDVLVGGLLLERWQKAQARARKAVADEEARLASSRDALQRLEVKLVDLPDVEADLMVDRANLIEAQVKADAATAARAAATAQLQDLDAQLADVQRAVNDVHRLEEERDAAAGAWLRAKAREDAAREQAERLTALLAQEPEIDAAVAAIPELAAKVEAHIKREADDRRTARELADLDRAIRDLELPHQRAVDRYNVERSVAEERVAEARAHLGASTATCIACGQPIDDKAVRAQITRAEAAVAALGEAPAEPAALAAVRANRAAVQAIAAQLAWDPNAMLTDRAELTRLERIAARKEDIDRARQQIAREVASIGEAHADLIQAEERGSAISSQLAVASAAVETARPLREARAAAATDLARAQLEVTSSTELVRLADRNVAAGETRLAALKAQEAEAAEIREQIEAGAEAASIDRRLDEVFGEIPLRIIDASLPDLEVEAQALLDLLDPGSIVRVAGQKATVDGKRVLSAIDITFQDDDGRRDVRMTSGGERVAVSVALSLGLRRVLSRQHGAQLRTAVIDEPDGLDAAQRLALVHAIRGLIAAGDLDRAGLITHHEDLGEAGDLQVLVSKNGHGSELQLVT